MPTGLKPERRPGHITVALCAHNREDTIEKAVRSILAQTYRNLDLCVVDDASTDGTAEVVRAMLPEDPRLTLLVLAENGGTYSAKNRVLRDYCRGEFYAHQDADDFSFGERFERQVEFLRANPQLAGCGTGVEEFYSDPSIALEGADVNPPSFDEEAGHYRRAYRYAPLLRKREFLIEFARSAHLEDIAMNGSILVRSAVMRSLGGFDGRTPVGGDYEFFLRLLALHDFGNLPEVLYARKHHRESLTRRHDVGKGSRVRHRYEDRWHGRYKALQPYLEAGDLGSRAEALRQDLFVAPSDVVVLNDTERAPASAGQC